MLVSRFRLFVLGFLVISGLLGIWGLCTYFETVGKDFLGDRGLGMGLGWGLDICRSHFLGIFGLFLGVLYRFGNQIISDSIIKYACLEYW